MTFLALLWVGAISGCQVDFSMSLSDWWEWHFHSCWFVLCQLDESWVPKSISGFLDRCFSRESTAGSSKDIVCRKHRRLERKFSYGLVYFISVHFWRTLQRSCMRTNSLFGSVWNLKRSVAVHTVNMKLHIQILNKLPFFRVNVVYLCCVQSGVSELQMWVFIFNA